MRARTRPQPAPMMAPTTASREKPGSLSAAFKAGEKERQDEDRTVPDAGAKGLFSVRSKEADDDPHNAPECQVPPRAQQKSVVTQGAAKKPERCCDCIIGGEFHARWVRLLHEADNARRLFKSDWGRRGKIIGQDLQPCGLACIRALSSSASV